MATKGIAARGTLLQRKVAEAFVTIAEVRTIAGPNMSTDTVDLTSHDSVDSYREKAADLKDPGQVDITGNLVLRRATTLTDPSHDQLLTDFSSGDVNEYRIIFPNHTVLEECTKWFFDAMVTEFATTANVGESVGFSAQFTISGKTFLGVTKPT